MIHPDVCVTMCSSANCVYANSPPMNHATLLAHADAHPMLPLENHVLPPNHKQLACPAFE